MAPHRHFKAPEEYPKGLHLRSKAPEACPKGLLRLAGASANWFRARHSVGAQVSAITNYRTPVVEDDKIPDDSPLHREARGAFSCESPTLGTSSPRAVAKSIW